jgi:hypothetical protein
MFSNTPFTAEGGCDCKLIRYRVHSKPIFVHCCHCRWCQRETGASFALNAMFESDVLRPRKTLATRESGKARGTVALD